MKLVINLNLEFSVLKKILKNSEEISFIYQKEKITFIVNHGEIYFIRTYDAYINEEPFSSELGEKLKIALNDNIKQELKYKKDSPAERYKEMVSLNDKIKTLKNYRC